MRSLADGVIIYDLSRRIRPASDFFYGFIAANQGLTRRLKVVAR